MIIAVYEEVEFEASSVYKELEEKFNAYIDVDEKRFKQCKKNVLKMTEAFRNVEKEYFRYIKSTSLTKSLETIGAYNRADYALNNALRITEAIEEENAIEQVVEENQQENTNQE